MSARSSARTTTSTGESREKLIGRLGAEIAELEAHVTAAVHRQLVAIREFDRLGAWADEGATSCAAWLTWRIGLSGPVARERVRVARALAELPLTSAEHAQGKEALPGSVWAVRRDRMAAFGPELPSAPVAPEEALRGQEAVFLAYLGGPPLGASPPAATSRRLGGGNLNARPAPTPPTRDPEAPNSCR